MTWFFYKDGRDFDVPASELEFKHRVTLIDPEDKEKSHFNRYPAHIYTPGRATTIFIERGTPFDAQLRDRIQEKLRT